MIGQVLARNLLCVNRWQSIELQKWKKIMNAHDKNLVLMMCMAAALVTLNFLAVISGAADGYYDQLTETLRPLLLSR